MEFTGFATAKTIFIFHPKTMLMRFLAIFLLFTAFGCNNVDDKNESGQDWALTGFERIADNPVLTPGNGLFHCPVRGEEVAWEAKDVFNPAAVVRSDTVWMIYRAEDTVGIHAGTSRLGLAWSLDGEHFNRLPEPVFYPDNDSMKVFEWEGGAEDPRIVETEDGRYIMTYTAYDGKIARLCLASSKDLIKWQKHGLVLGAGKFRNTWSKSGSIVCRREGNRLLATKVNGKYWMYWGDTDIFAATSDDLIHWEPVLNEKGELLTVFGPRPGMFDCQLVEPGPPALLTGAGILLIYNSRNLDEGGDPALPPGTYTAGQVLLDATAPLRVKDRLDHYFFKPEFEFEKTGQVGNVVFLEGLVPFKGKWFLYYGTADSKIAAGMRGM